MYDSKLIRTGNMLPDRSTDIHFDSEKEPSLTQQQFTDECDVNRIVRSHGFTPADISQMRFADVSEVVSYEEALQTVRKAQESFSALPADVRARFDNDPAQFVNFIDNSANAEELVKMGLAIPRKGTSDSEPKQTPEPVQEPLA